MNRIEYAKSNRTSTFVSEDALHTMFFAAQATNFARLSFGAIVQCENVK